MQVNVLNTDEVQDSLLSMKENTKGKTQNDMEKPGMAAHTCHPSIQKAEVGVC